MSEGKDTQPGLVEVEFQPVNDRSETVEPLNQSHADPEIVADITPRNLDVTAGERDIFDLEDIQELVLNGQEGSRVTYPP